LCTTDGFGVRAAWHSGQDCESALKAQSAQWLNAQLMTTPTLRFASHVRLKNSTFISHRGLAQFLTALKASVQLLFDEVLEVGDERCKGMREPEGNQ
jgi:hypothetical protein